MSDPLVKEPPAIGVGITVGLIALLVAGPLVGWAAGWIAAGLVWATEPWEVPSE